MIYHSFHAMDINYAGNCPKCGKPYYYIGDPIGDVSQLICQCNNKKAVQPNYAPVYGWVCPICGAVYAPWVGKCEGYHPGQAASTIITTDNVTRSED